MDERGSPAGQSQPESQPKSTKSNSISDNAKNGFSQAKTAFFELSSSTNVFAIIAFFILVVILFIILLRLGVALIAMIFSSKNNVRLITGVVSGNTPRVFPQDPTIEDSVTIQRSNNASGGIEFTWSVWINVNTVVSAGSSSIKYQNIFTKGNSNVSADGVNTPNNAPGLYIANGTNTLLFIMNSFEVLQEEILIPDIPLNKWVSVVMTCQNKTISIYINGVIAKSEQLIGVPKQNYGDVFVALGGGFNGSISNLWYWNRKLDIGEIQTLYSRGPNTRTIGNLNANKKSGDNYLSLDWYFNN